MRKSGVLMSLSSLPGPGGIGTMGQPARAFVDFLAQAGQSCWQLLPIGPTGYGNSPYQSLSAFAGNPVFLDLDTLTGQGLLDKGGEAVENTGVVDYAALWPKVQPKLEEAVTRFLHRPPPDFPDFCAQQGWWLDDYALFMSIKQTEGQRAWFAWPDALGTRRPEELDKFRAANERGIAFWRVVQYLFFDQWRQLKAYAKGKGVQLIGDLPIYVAPDSVEVWAHPELFQLDENGLPREVAGCPPDGFSPAGQRWGNPLYDWERMERDNFAWWVKRMDYSFGLYDMLRLDHFRGFESYYAIPRESVGTENGRWRTGPGMKLFRAIGERSMIAEDLGFLTPEVRRLLQESGLPGMNVLQFAFDRREGDSRYLPHNYPVHCVAYTGTHDNDTILGWLTHGDRADADYAAEYLRLGRQEPHWDMMSALWASAAHLTIVTAQDLLGLGSHARMNTPGTVEGNWCWRAKENSFTPELAQKLRRKMELYQRC